MKNKPLLMYVLAVFVPHLLLAGTTGKIAGTIIDAETGASLPGVNVVIEGTTLGAATNKDGYYVILNLPPGKYNLKATMIGYADYLVRDVAVNIDLTTTIDIKLKPTVVALGEEVVVVAERPVIKVDVSASQSNIEGAQIAALPVQSLEAVVGLQAGIRGLEIRGGGIDQTAFMVDGVVLRDERTNKPIANIAINAVQEIQVQSGGFAAEYGDIRSGVINVVTKDVSQYSGTIEARYSPAAQKHFGPSIYDPYTYWTRPYLDDAVCWTGTKSGAWDPFTQKQYVQFDGWNAVSKRTLEDNDPKNDLTPEAAQRLYQWQHRRQGDIKDPDYIIDAGFGGPFPVIGEKLGNLRFFGSHRQEQNMYLLPLSRDYYRDFTSQLKLTADVSKSMKLTISGLYGEIHAVNDNNNGEAGYFYDPAEIAYLVGGGPFLFRSFRDAIMYAPEYYAPTDIYTRQFSAKLTHVLSPHTFYEASLEQGGRNYYTYPSALRDTSRVYKFGNTYYVDEAPFGFQPLPSTGIDGLRMGVGMSNSRDWSHIRSTTFKFNLTSQITANNEIKTGVEVLYGDHNVNYRSIDIVLPASRPATVWRRFPVRGGAYFQDKIEFKGLIANLGLRVDYLHAQGDWYDVDTYDRLFYSDQWTPEYDLEAPRKATERKVYLSPRLGVAHPITVDSKLYFNYGHFRQKPDPATLYQNRRVTGNRVDRIGAPDNELSKTIAYELGYEHNLFNQFLLKLAGYYKDVSEQPKYVRFLSADSKVNYYKALNTSYEDIRGFEFQLNKNYGTWVNGFVNYTYQVITYGFFGKDLYFENRQEQRVYDRTNIPQVKPRSRPYARANVAVTTPDDFGPKVAGNHLLGAWQASFVANWRAGEWITYNPGNVPGILYNIQWDDYFNVNLRLSKNFRIKNMNVRFFMDVNNVLNTKNFSFYGFGTKQDYDDYMQSLRLPKEAVEKLGYIMPHQTWRYGDDKVGDFRPDDVTYEPYDPADPTKTEADLRRILETKAYIDNPNLSYFWYLNPRDIFFGLRVSFDFK